MLDDQSFVACVRETQLPEVRFLFVTSLCHLWYKVVTVRRVLVSSVQTGLINTYVWPSPQEAASLPHVAADAVNMCVYIVESQH